MTEISFTKVASPYGWLGNMAPYTVAHDGFIYRTSEALFQALRFSSAPLIDGRSIRELIRDERSPMTAKMVAKKYAGYRTLVSLGPEDLSNMRLVLRLKLEQHPALRSLLLETGSATLIEDCSARPRGSGLFWGAARMGDGWQGQNWLGKMWMELRAGL